MKLVDEKIEDYCRAHTTPLPEIFTRLREATFATMPLPQMQVGLLEGRFLALLVAITGAKRVLELGTYTGFSALAMASALPEDGKLITCDMDPNATGMARKFWAESPHGKKIELKLGQALDSIDQIHEPLDLVFIDADKPNYIQYWEKVLPKLRKGGVIAVDNVLWSGTVLDPKEKSDHAIVSFNEHARADKRVELVMLTLRDGLLLGRKL